MAISTALRETKLENNKFQNVLHHQQEVMANEFIYVLNFHFQRNTHFQERLDIFLEKPEGKINLLLVRLFYQ